MCGICGLVGRDLGARPLTSAELRRMTDAIHHRGPDEDGHHLAEGVGLGMRRLSIIDLPGGSQPISNEDGTVVTVFNGEIFNFRELRKELAAKGHHLVSEGDTETIVHLYEEHGEDFPARLRGMFAIAVWDDRRKRLLLTRDRMGVKPLYLAELAEGLAFASEVKSLIASGHVRPALDPVAAELFMAYGYVPGPRSLFAGVRKLMPATTLVWEESGGLREHRYWDPHAAAPAGLGRSWEEDQERLLETLRDATRARMVSDVPLGVMLSGGLDSSLIAALMAEASSGPVSTFSIGFVEDGDANELDDAALVAGRLGTDHHPLMTSAVDHPELLDEALWHLEEPVADLSQLGFLLLSRLAREHVTVALSGQGADELLGGYRKHQVARAAQAALKAPRGLRSLALAAARLGPEESNWVRGTAALLSDDPATRMLAMSRVVQRNQRRQIFSPEFLQPDAEEAIREAIRQHLPTARLSVLGETLHLDWNLALVDDMLLYFDKMSMAASLEVRVPFMDHDLVSLCSALPDSRRVWRMRRKELLRRASRGLVPDEVIEKKKRAFFRGALGAWLRVHREDLFEQTLLDPRALERGQYRPEAVRALLAGGGNQGLKADQRLFCLLLLEKWQRIFTDEDGRARRMGVADVAPSEAR